MHPDRVEVEIRRLGAQGDGVAEQDGAQLFVPRALPGERWAIGPGAAARLTSSPDRVAPPCRHFGTCGGCQAQHMSDAIYAPWKEGVVAEAFRHRGLEPAIAPLVRVPPGTRRRAVLGAAVKGGKVVLGFREEGEHRLVDLAECLVLDPSIVAAFDLLREIAGLLLAHAPKAKARKRGERGARLTVTRLDHGLDVSVDAEAGLLPAILSAKLAGIAEKAHFVRLTVDGDGIVMRARPELTLGGVVVEPPPGVFLQAVPEAEQQLRERVVAAISRAKRIADLFAGLGTFTFALARKAEVLALDGDKRAIAALSHAARHAQGLKRIETRVRDLYREPLSRTELAAFDAVVFDPPRAGAEEQAVALARARVPLVVAVSCNPATLARDARKLVDGGYRIAEVTPVDQFLWTPHIEVVAVFRR